MNSAILIALLITCLGIPLTVVDKTYSAYQEGAIANAWAAVGSLTSLAAVLLVIWLHGGLTELVVGLSGSIFLIKLISGGWLFAHHKPWLAPWLSRFERMHIRRLTVAGFEFFILQITVLILFQTDNLLIAHFVGTKVVAEYSVIYRLFAQITMVQMLLIGPLWPAYGEAVVRGDWAWVRSTFRHSLVFNLSLFGPVIALLCMLGRPIIRLWTGNAIDPDQLLIILVALWSLMVIWGNTFSMLLNGLKIIRLQAFLSVVMSALNLSLSLLWVRQYGAHGVILATLVAYGLTSLWTAPVVVYRTLRRHASL